VEIFVLSALLGVVNAFDIPARQAFIVEMTAARLDQRHRSEFIAFNGARIVGPAVAESWWPRWRGLVLLRQRVSYLAVIAGLLMMHVQPFRARHGDSSALRHVMEDSASLPIRSIRAAAAGGLVSLFGMPFSVLMRSSPIAS